MSLYAAIDLHSTNSEKGPGQIKRSKIPTRRDAMLR